MRNRLTSLHRWCEHLQPVWTGWGSGAHPALHIQLAGLAPGVPRGKMDYNHSLFCEICLLSYPRYDAKYLYLVSMIDNINVWYPWYKIFMPGIHDTQILCHTSTIHNICVWCPGYFMFIYINDIQFLSLASMIHDIYVWIHDTQCLVSMIDNVYVWYPDTQYLCPVSMILNIYIWIVSLILWIRSHPIKFSHIELLKKLLHYSTGSVTTRNLWQRSYPGTNLLAKFDHNLSWHEPNSIYVYLYIIFEKRSPGALDTPPGGSKWITRVGDYVDNLFTALGSSDPWEVRLEL